MLVENSAGKLEQRHGHFFKKWLISSDQSVSPDRSEINGSS